MNDKFRYLLKRILSAGIDLIFFAILCKLLQPITKYQNLDGNYYTPIGVVILIYYVFSLFQESFFGRTLGKYLFKLEIKELDNLVINKHEKVFRLFIRRSFDLLDLICPFFYILFIMFNKKNQKFGDYISNMLVSEK